MSEHVKTCLCARCCMALRAEAAEWRARAEKAEADAAFWREQCVEWKASALDNLFSHGLAANRVKHLEAVTAESEDLAERNAAVVSAFRWALEEITKYYEEELEDARAEARMWQEECAELRDAEDYKEAAYWRHVDHQIDSRRNGDWEAARFND